MSSVTAAKSCMKKFERVPVSPDAGIGTLEEVFCHTTFVSGSASERREIMLRSSEASYRNELAYAWDHYFGSDLCALLRGKEALDLGCFNGGRSAAWFEKYELERLVGVDVRPVHVAAATQFAEMRGIGACYAVAGGESLPFCEQAFDAVLSFEVFEHLRDVQRTLSECYRILRPGGRLFVVFPGYYHPTSHHLSLATTSPGLQYLFRGETLVNAYYEVLRDRGEAADWYRRESPRLESWEKGNTINGTTAAQFHKLVKAGDWHIMLRSRKPIGSIGRTVGGRGISKLASLLFYPMAHLPMLQEAFLHRITYILEKGRSGKGVLARG